VSHSEPHSETLQKLATASFLAVAPEVEKLSSEIGLLRPGEVHP